MVDGQKKLERKDFGHNNGVNSVRDTIEASIDIGVKNLTLYVFSMENWKRPEAEVRL